LVGLDVVVALAVGVGVENERRPALRFSPASPVSSNILVLSQPATGPVPLNQQRVAGVVAELRVMGAEAGIDEGVLHRLGSSIAA